MTEDPEGYYKRAKTWALDEQGGLRSQLRLSRIFASGALVIAILEAFALLLLTPLKTATSVPILVDRQTGHVEVLGPDGRIRLRANDALTRSMLAQYVMAREGFDITDLSAEYRKVALWSAGAARQDYLAVMPASNSESPLHRYPRSTIVDTRIKSISPLGPEVALVRFETRRNDQDGRASKPEPWAATVTYHYVDQAMSAEDRFTNPLGFQVVRYHRDPETIAPDEPTPESATTATVVIAPQAAPIQAVSTATTAAGTHR